MQNCTSSQSENQHILRFLFVGVFTTIFLMYGLGVGEGSRPNDERKESDLIYICSVGTENIPTKTEKT
jgi:hypothetical protein